MPAFAEAFVNNWKLYVLLQETEVLGDSHKLGEEGSCVFKNYLFTITLEIAEASTNSNSQSSSIVSGIQLDIINFSELRSIPRPTKHVAPSFAVKNNPKRV